MKGGGGYLHLDSPLHHLDARAKVASTLCFLIGIFVIHSWVGYALTGGLLLFVARIGKIPVPHLVRAVKGVSVLLFFTFCLNAFFTPGDIVAAWGPAVLTEQGLARGAALGLRLALIVAATTLLTAVTPPLALAEGLESLLSPLRALRVPVPELAMITSIALRFVPILVAETGRITRAQAARGVEVSGVSGIRRAVTLAPILIPLFSGALRRADDLGNALRARAYVPGKARGALKPRVLGRGDAIALGFSVLTLVLLWFWG